MGTEADAPPFPSPPRSVRLVVLKLTRKEESNDDFVDCPLNEDDSDQSQDRMRDFPTLKEPLFPAFQQDAGRKERTLTKNSKNATAPTRPNT